jgi:hypothetical protein
MHISFPHLGGMLGTQRYAVPARCAQIDTVQQLGLHLV